MRQLSQGETRVFFLGAFLFLVLIAFAFLTATAHGQEVNMNQPSADIVDKGHLFVRSDSFYTQKPAYFFENVINFAYGLGHNLEVSVNGSDLAHGSDIWQIVPGFKWAPIKNEELRALRRRPILETLSNFTLSYHQRQREHTKPSPRSLTAGTCVSPLAHINPPTSIVRGTPLVRSLVSSTWRRCSRTAG
jgi:hypothetical protein